MSNYISKSLSYEKEEERRKKLTYDFLCKEYKKKKLLHPLWILIIIAITAFLYWLLWLSFSDLSGFVAILIKASMAIPIILSAATIIHEIHLQYSTIHALKNKKYSIITDTIASFEEKQRLAVKGHGKHAYIGMETKYYVRMSRFGLISVDEYFSERHSTGSTFYIVVSNKKPKRAIFLFDINQYELDENEIL